MARQGGGDDEAWGDFEVDDGALLEHGGGAYGGDDAEEDEDGSTWGDVAEETPQSDHLAEDKKRKKREKLNELKLRKKQKLTSAAYGDEVEEDDEEGDKEAKSPEKGSISAHHLSADEQWSRFNLNQPLNASGGLTAQLSLADFLPLSDPATAGGDGGDVFLRAVSLGLGPSWKAMLNKPMEERGCPLVLVLCSGAKRAAEVINSLSQRVHCRISKLFAKHFKVTEQVETLAKHHYPIAVGTPNRVHTLLELGALCLRSTLVVLVDLKEDAKQFSTLTLDGVREDLYKLLGTWVCAERKKRPDIKVGLVADVLLPQSKAKAKTKQGGGGNGKPKHKSKFHNKKKGESRYSAKHYEAEDESC
jgi:protein CMS1